MTTFEVTIKILRVILVILHVLITLTRITFNVDSVNITIYALIGRVLYYIA